jgi:hypothetical protein
VIAAGPEALPLPEEEEPNQPVVVPPSPFGDVFECTVHIEEKAEEPVNPFTTTRSDQQRLSIETSLNLSQTAKPNSVGSPAVATRPLRKEEGVARIAIEEEELAEIKQHRAVLEGIQAKFNAAQLMFQNTSESFRRLVFRRWVKHCIANRKTKAMVAVAGGAMSAFRDRRRHRGVPGGDGTQSTKTEQTAPSTAAVEPKSAKVGQDEGCSIM